MKTGKFYSRWQIVAVLWLMMAFPVSFVHGQEKESAQQTDSSSRGGYRLYPVMSVTNREFRSSVQASPANEQGPESSPM